MNIYTQEDFDAMPVVGGRKKCPIGDYSQIKRFHDRCDFNSGSKFGAWVRFGEECRFGANCSFDSCCGFGNWCRFEWGCDFGKWCGFNNWCRFGLGCSFGEACGFGEGCSFSRKCTFEGGRITPKKWRKPYVAIDGIGANAAKPYFFNDAKKGLIVRDGGFLGGKRKFLAKIYANYTPHKTRACKLAIQLAEHQLGIKATA